MKPDYPISYSISFVIFWGAAFAGSLAFGGLLAFAVTATVLLMLIHHEHAHAKKCIELNIPVYSITFYAFGGAVEAELPYTQDGIDVFIAGPVNSGCYAVAFTALFLTIGYLGSVFSWNMADAMPLGMLYWKQFINSLTLSSIALVVTNILPIGWYSKEHGCMVAVDGFAAYLRREQRDELWNDGKYLPA